MATEVEITTAIDTAQTQQGLSGLRKSLKELISLQGQVGSDSKHFHKLQDAINKTDGKVSDLTTSFQTLRGNGVDRLNTSIGLFKDGLLNADTGKLKIGLEGIGSAMKAIPIFLLIEGAQLLIANWDKLTASFSESAKQARENEKALKDLTFQVNAQKVALDQSLISKEQELKNLREQGAGLKDVVSKLQEINKIKQTGIQGEIKKVDKEMQNIIASVKDLKENVQLSDALPEFLGGGETEKKIEELMRKLEELSIRRGNLNTQLKEQAVKTEDEILQATKDANEKALKAREERIKKVQELIELNRKQEAENEEARIKYENEQHQKELDEVAKFIEAEKRLRQDARDFQAALDEGQAINEALIADAINADNLTRFRNNAAIEKAAIIQTTAEKIEAVKFLRDQELAQEQLTVDQRVAIVKKAEDDILAIRTESQLKTLEISSQYLQVLSNINEFHNQNQLKELKDLERAKQRAVANGTKTQIEAEAEYLKASLKIKKEQFEKEKILKIANIAIDTASNLVKTTAQLGGVGAATPAGLLMLAGITALGITQAAIVANSEFDDSSSAPSIPSANVSGGSGAAPSFERTPERAPTTFNPQAQVNGRQNQALKVVVLQSDIKEVTEQVEVLESRATFGEF